MNARQLPLLGALAALALISACAYNPPRSEPYGNAPVPASTSPYAVEYGRVSSIEVVPVASRGSGGGAVLGAVLGAVIGNQVGSGSGRAVATGVGAVGGAVIGNSIEQRNRSDSEVYRVSVRLDNGRIAQFDYQRIDDLRIGDRVKIEDGQLHRV